MPVRERLFRAKVTKNNFKKGIAIFAELCNIIIETRFHDFNHTNQDCEVCYMKNFVLSTESGSDPSEEMVRAFDLHVLPMHVALGSESRDDGAFPVKDVFGYYDKTAEMPQTSAVNPAEYIDFFQKLRAENPDAEIVHIAYTSLASCTYQNAVIALRELGDEHIHLVDSLNVSGGISLILWKAHDVLAEASCLDTALREIRAYIVRAKVAFLPNTLEYLKAGGRVSNAAYLGGTLLKLKPLIRIRGGKLVASKMYRGAMNRVVFAYIDDFIAGCSERSKFVLFYVEGFSMELLAKIRQYVLDKGFREVMITHTGSVIACHGGPGALGLAAC